MRSAGVVKSMTTNENPIGIHCAAEGCTVTTPCSLCAEQIAAEASYWVPVHHNGVELTTHLEPATRWRGEQLEVRVQFDLDHSAKVSVYGPRRSFGQMQEAQVNWSALGSVSPADAVAYAAALDYAARAAVNLAGPTGEEDSL